MAEDEIVTVEQVGGVTVAKLHPSDITPEMAPLLYGKLLDGSGSGAPRLVLDLSSLKSIGSVGLSALIVLLKRVKEKEGCLALTGLAARCLDVMKVTGLTSVFDIFPDTTSALNSLR